MTWDIPVGWTYREPKWDESPEKNFPVQYLSMWILDDEGTISKAKHGHTVRRGTNGVVRLDGVIVNGN